MHTRTRKLIGTVLLLTFVVVYMALAMVVAGAALDGRPGWLQGLGYAFAGLIWIVPAGAIIAWMSKGDRKSS